MLENAVDFFKFEIFHRYIENVINKIYEKEGSILYVKVLKSIISFVVFVLRYYNVLVDIANRF